MRLVSDWTLRLAMAKALAFAAASALAFAAVSARAFAAACAFSLAKASALALAAFAANCGAVKAWTGTARAADAIAATNTKNARKRLISGTAEIPSAVL